MRRFVILQHQPGAALNRTAGVHLDWMFQFDHDLQTWATDVFGDHAATAAAFAQPFTLAAERLVDHRTEYLDFEGEVSGGRGHVSRVLMGKFEPQKRSTNPTQLLLDCQIECSSGVITGTLHLAGPTEPDTGWTIRWSPAEQT